MLSMRKSGPCCIKNQYNYSLKRLTNAIAFTKYSLVTLHSSFTHMMDPLAKHGIEILFPTSVMYSLNFITDVHTDNTEIRKIWDI